MQLVLQNVFTRNIQRREYPLHLKFSSNSSFDCRLFVPADIISRTWVCVCKEYQTCAVLYYVSVPVNIKGKPGHILVINELKTEDVGDVLYIKLEDGEVVDVEEEEMDDVLCHIVHYL